MTLFTLQHLLSVDHKTELQLQKFCRLATHDRVNYSVEKSEVNIDKEAMEITLKLTIDAAACDISGQALAGLLRQKGVECEFADPETLVLMITPQTDRSELLRAEAALGVCSPQEAVPGALPIPRGQTRMSIREAVFAPHETIPADKALGRVCGSPTVACPPAIPIAVSGEEITREAIALFAHYGIDKIDVLR